ncbi:MAG: ATP-binding cassette domain-containing protein [Candidatus Omnitrophica bacterium]|nr:ATP-binding cassette domain-containing protein [Candidatus Omnitrophota bacterium]
MDVVSLKDISVMRSGRRVLHRLSWTTRYGEHWAVMGPNGSGKSTLMEILLGYLWPKDGEVSVLGRTFGHTNLWELRALVGYVAPWVFKRMAPETIVFDAVASGVDGSIGAPTRISPGLKKDIMRQLRFFACLHLKDRPFGELSSGQQLKVALARALVHGPKVLILDEPFSLLDVGARVRMYQCLEKLVRRKNAPQVILVTHHQADMLSFLTHGLILKDGRVFMSAPRKAAFAPAVLARAFGISKELFSKYF